MCFRLLLNEIRIPKEKVPTFEKRSLRIGILNCCELQVSFKIQSKLSNNFRFKGPIPRILTPVVVYKFHCGLCNESFYRECIGHLAVRNG